MGNFVDITGQRFHRLVALSHVKESRPTRFVFRCDCGAVKVIRVYSVLRGDTGSCGCFRLEQQKRTDNKGSRKHGQSRSPTYTCWRSMLNRCRQNNHPDWPRYGGRGISVCQQWKGSFANFLADMGERPSRQHTLDRIDVNGNYEPGNCKWSLPDEQGNNTRVNSHLDVDGEIKTISQWAKCCGIGKSTIMERVKRGWSAKDAVTIPPMRKGIEFLDPARKINGCAKFKGNATS